MNMRCNAVLALCAALMFAGCTRVVVKKATDDDDKGFRYYRPKPYLFITPGDTGGGGGGNESTFSINQHKALVVSPQTTDDKAEGVQAGYFSPDAMKIPDCPPTEEPDPAVICTTDMIPAPKKISMELVYMPDFAEEYSVQLKPGLGVGEVNMKLEDGWKLTSVGVKTDQQVDEIISSVAELVKAGSGLIPSSTNAKAADTTSCPPCPPSGIYATNIPFGFYEAVIAEDPCGRKQLYGWRYVGFMPFQSCPTQPCGMQCVGCESDAGVIYGLVWVNGILQFQEINCIPKEPQP